ncbi:hypothetical protein [Massilia aquatica]|uniref:Uncharacterized protein n=1 Tax=Massilia aquatica TaxID=2609000 RepID=A0ABX0MNJ0_9BURK|nr:hypothetical protein [Massilia aquatica]NHZ43746.1 hypothetical protein [Massilia aquatica]
MKKYFLSALCLSISLPAFSGPQPKSVANERPLSVVKEDVRADRVIKKNEMSNEQRAFVWQDKTVDAAGYFLVRSTQDYLDLPTTIFKHPGFLPEKNTSVVARGDVKLLGRFVEDENRVTWAFSHSNSNMLLTVWKYKLAGAVYTVSEEFLNQSVDGAPAVLSLSYAEKTEKALWKLTWWKNGEMFEFYVSDILKNGKPSQKSVNDILQLAKLAIIYPKK